jgi:hypothetical protein
VEKKIQGRSSSDHRTHSLQVPVHCKQVTNHTQALRAKKCLPHGILHQQLIECNAPAVVRTMRPEALKDCMVRGGISSDAESFRTESSFFSVIQSTFELASEVSG